MKMDSSKAFQLYRMYSIAAREEAGRQMSDALSEIEFVTVWRSLPETQRRRWETRFEAGFEKTIASESLRYASVLSNDKFAKLKAA
jgi:hypothetical protein